MKFFQKIFLFVLLGLVFPLNLPAELKLPDVTGAYVSDFANLLDASQRQNLEQQLYNLERANSNQVLVVTVPDLQEETIEEYALRLAEKWKPGQKGRDNGVILLVAPKERKVRIEVGYGLEGALPDATAKTIIEQEIVPSFRQGDFVTGIFNGVAAIAAATQGEYEPLAAHNSKNLKSFSKLLGFFLALIFFVFLSWAHRGRSFGHSRQGWHAAAFLLGAFLGGGGRGSGRSSWGGGGGFSGGGGGFGGGGASGGW